MDVVDSFPRFFGTDPRRTAIRSINSFMLAVRATQIYPLLIEAMFLPSLARSGRGVLVHGKVDKWGIHAETLTATSLDDLVHYLEGRKAGVAREELAAFQPYLSDQFVLVAAWISSREELIARFGSPDNLGNPDAGRHPCLYVEFPTQRPFYPLKPTSSYGDVLVPVQLCVVGCFEPKNGPKLSTQVSVRYYRQERAAMTGPRVFLEALPNGRFFYTRVQVLGKASDLTEDLWFSPVQQPDTRLADAIEALSPPVVALPVYLAVVGALSYVSAGLCALVLYGQWRGYARVGLWNLLTLVGLVFAIRHIPGERGTRLRGLATRHGMRVGRFWFLFTFVYLFLAISLHLLVLAALR